MTNVVDMNLTDVTVPEIRVFTEGFILTSADRCDECSAQAYYLVTLQNNGELLFCNHHYAKNREALARVSARIHDESAQLNR